MNLRILLLLFVLIPTTAVSKNISGTYVASTNYGNIFCIDLIQKDEVISGSFDEVDFKQVVAIEKGVYQNNRLSFDVSFKLDQRMLLLSMTAKEIKESPRIFFGSYLIGREKGDFILYSVKSKPRVCQNLHKK